MAGNNLNLSLKISALVEGVEKIRELAKAISDATKGQGKASTAATDDLTKSAAGAAKATQKLGEETAKTNREMVEADKAAKNNTNSITDLNKAVNNAVRGLKFLAGGFLALKSVQVVKDFADTAARTETLGVVLNTVGRNAGYTSAELAKADKEVQALGITASASRESLTKLLQADIDLSFAPKLARAAQDLAVVSGQNSSETLSRLITNIQQMDTTGLRFMGIVIDREAVMQKAERETGKAVEGRAAKVVFANAVLAEATKLQGIYEESLQTVGKQLTSLPRYVENFKVALGNTLLPVYLELVKGGIEILKSFNVLAQAFVKTSGEADRLHSSLEVVSASGSVMADVVQRASKAIADFIKFLAENMDTVKTFAFYLSAIWAAFKVLAGLQALTTFFVAFIGGATTLAAIIPTVVLAVKSFAAAATIAGAAAAFAFSPVLITVGAIAAALGVAYGAYKLFFSKGKGDAKGVKDELNSVQQDIDAYVASLEKSSKIRAELVDLAAQGSTANNLLTAAESTGDAKRIDSAKKVADAIGQRVKLLSTELEKETANRKLIDARLTQAQTEKKITEEQYKQKEAAEARAAAVQKAAKLAEAAKDALQKSLKDAGIDFAEFTTGVDKQFKTTVDGIVAGAENIGTEGSDAALGVRALIDKLEELAQKTKTPEELERFAKALKSVQEASQKAAETGQIKPGQGLEEGLAAKLAAEARRNAEKAKREREAGGAQALSQANALANAIQDAVVARAKNIFDISKALGELSLSETKRQYDLGLVNTEDYFERRLQLTADNGKKELEVEQATLQALIIKRKQATDPAAIKSAQTAIDNQRAKIAQVQIKQQSDVDALQGERDQARIERIKTITELTLKAAVAADDSDLVAQIALVNEEYDDRIVKLKAINDIEALAAINRERAQRIHQLQLDIETKQLQRKLALDQADIDQQQAKLSLAQKAGRLTDTEAQNANNDLIARRIALQQQQRAAVAEQLRRETEAVEQGVGGSVQTINDLKLRLVDLDNQILSLSGQTRTYAEAIRANFTDSLTAGIDQVLAKGKSLQEAFKGVLKSVRDQVSQIVSRDLAQKAVKVLVELTGGEGKSIFDKLGGLLGDSKPGSTPTSPMYVSVTNLPGGGLVGSTQTGGLLEGIGDSLKTAFSTLKDSFGELFGSLTSALSSSFGTLFGGGGEGGGSWITGLMSFFGFAEGGLIRSARRLAGGGPISGPGTSTSDSIPIMASDGEYMIRAPAVRQWGTSFLDFINGVASRPRAPRYAEGGPIRDFHVAGDMTTAGVAGRGIDKVITNIDARADSGQVQQMVARGVRDGIEKYDAQLRAQGKIR